MAVRFQTSSSSRMPRATGSARSEKTSAPTSVHALRDKGERPGRYRLEHYFAGGVRPKLAPPAERTPGERAAAPPLVELDCRSLDGMCALTG